MVVGPQTLEGIAMPLCPKDSPIQAPFQRQLEPRSYSLERFCRNFIKIFQHQSKKIKEQRTLESYQKVPSLKDLGSSFRWNDASLKDGPRRNYLGDFSLKIIGIKCG